MYGPFLWVVFNYLKAPEPLKGDNLLFNTKSLGKYWYSLINLKRMKDWVDLRATLPQSTGFLTSDSHSDNITRDINIEYILGVKGIQIPFRLHFKGIGKSISKPLLSQGIFPRHMGFMTLEASLIWSRSKLSIAPAIYRQLFNTRKYLILDFSIPDEHSLQNKPIATANDTMKDCKSVEKFYFK